MRSWISFCTVTALVLGVTSTPIDSTSHSVVERSPDASSTKSQLRVLCVGASIVWGYGSTDENGFRQGLRSALVGAGHDVDMIGSRQHGSMSDNDVEAWPGFRIEEVAAKFGQDVPGLPSKADIVLLHVGTNDLLQNFKVSTMQERYSSLIDQVFGLLPDTIVVMSTLLPSGSVDSGVQTFNARLPGILEAQLKKGRHVVLADVHTSDFSLSDLISDGTHPNNGGYAKMAGVFAGKMLEAVGKFAAPTVQSSPTPQPTPQQQQKPADTPVAVPTTSTMSQQSTSSSTAPTPAPTSTSILQELPQSTTSSAVPSSTSTKESKTSSISVGVVPANAAIAAPSTTSTASLSSASSTSSTDSSTVPNTTFERAAASTTSSSPPPASSTAKGGASSLYDMPRQILVLLACTLILLAI